MKSYYVYILLCNDGLTYTGVTNNISRRLYEHQEGTNIMSFTFKRRPVSLLFYQEFSDIVQAMFFEKKIKNWSSCKKKALAKSDYNLQELLAECRNNTHYKSMTKVGLDSARPEVG